MELSVDQNLHEQFKFFKSRNEFVTPKLSPSQYNDFDIIDVSKINFEDDESWLYKAPGSCEKKIENLHEWLHKDISSLSNYEHFTTQVFQKDIQKNIDTRTFTRPKKRFTRPSIEKFNEEVYGTGSSFQNDLNLSQDGFNRSFDSGILPSNFTIQEVGEPVNTFSSKPLSFDLSQPSQSYYFDTIANSADVDSFQNMSPPSLVNSMCSSTFANLMESSFIKNDPDLREIRDTDFTETILLQDSEPPMFQSITESCSSINSDTPESFLKKVSYNGTFRKNASNDCEKSQNTTYELNATYEKVQESDSPIRITTPNRSHEDIPSSQSFTNFNGTYCRTPKPNGTFRKSDVRSAISALNSTFETSPKITDTDHNSQTLIKDRSQKSFERSQKIIKDDSMEDMKKRLSNTQLVTDLNRLSYCLDENIRLDSTFTDDNNDLNRTVNLRGSSLGCSTGSADSLDRMSSLSNSSKGSNKMLEMADVDAIVEMQERSLQQVMSTPKQPVGPKKLWENNFISPIISSDPPLSDSDEEDFKSVKSALSSKASLENYCSKPTKSLVYLGGEKPTQTIPSNLRASYTNLRTIKSNIPGSQNNLYRPSNTMRPPPSTNLNSMAPRLKGSYTSLRPMTANLPVAPPINAELNTTKTLLKATNPNVTQNIESHTKVVPVPPMPREKIPISSENLFVKPQIPRASGLPRPTGIPRPASRIPGPRSNNLRPSTSRSSDFRRELKDDYQ